MKKIDKVERQKVKNKLGKVYFQGLRKKSI
jgi:hypothetical protein